MSTTQKIKEAFAEFEIEDSKFELKSNNTAGRRARGKLMEIIKLCKTRRDEIQAKKNSQDGSDTTGE